MHHQELFSNHISTLIERTTKALQASSFDALVIDAGIHFTYFCDDQHPTHMSTPHFRHWVPINTQSHMMEFRIGHKPKLLYYYPDDFWHEQIPLGSPYWANAFEVQQFGSQDALIRALSPVKSTAYIGPRAELATTLGMAANPAKLVSHLDWNRSFKTPYEIACISEANRRAATGHRVARKLFEGGASELEIHYGYLAAMNCLEKELPYGAIIALNEKAAILHYEYKRMERDGRVLLIDAGAPFESFCSDITRTWVQQKYSSSLFSQILADIDAMQKKLCGMCGPKVNYVDLHHATHLGVAEILLKHKVIKGISAEAAITEGLTGKFFPHGLGHQLGIQVHDVAGQQVDHLGTPGTPPAQYPRLRSTRMLDVGMVLTIEPGIYFIPVLLQPAKSGKLGSYIDWKLIDELIPFGGIRIEDDVLVTESGHRNLTREHLPE